MVTPGMTTKSGCPEGAYVNHAPKKLLPCCASVSPHPDSVDVHQRSVLSTPQLAGALPNDKRWMRVVLDAVPGIVQLNVAAPPPALKSNEAVPTFVVLTSFGLNWAFANDGPVVR